MSITIPINIFNGGMSPDARATYSECQLCKHFDNFTKEHSLIPYRKSVSAEDINLIEATSQLQNFLVYTTGGQDYLYALGVASGKAIIWYSGVYPTDTPTWSQASSGSDPTNTISNFSLFIEHLGIIFGSNSQGIWSWNIGTPAFTTAAQTFSFDTITQGLVHSKNGFLYIGYTYQGTINIARRDLSGNWNLTALSIASLKYKIVSLCEFGNYLAIGLAPIQFGSKSQVLLWDRDESLATVSETLDFGDEILQQIEQIDTYIVGVSAQQNIGNLAQYLTPKLVFKQSNGSSAAIKFKEILLNSFTSVIGKQKFKNRMYFGLSATSNLVDGVTNDFTGIWSVGVNGSGKPMTVQFDRLVNGNTVAKKIYGFFIAGDYFYTAFSTASTSIPEVLTKTQGSGTTSYSDTAVYRTVINPRMNVAHLPVSKQLEGVALTYVPITSASYQIVLKFRVDGSKADGSDWVTCFTRTGASVVGEQVFETPSDANGLQFNKGRDLEFQIESNGVEVTGLFYKYDVSETLLS